MIQMQIAQKGSSIRMKKIVLAVVLTCIVFATGIMTAHGEEKIKIEQTTLGASKIMVAVPENWNKNVVMLAHGWRLESAPLTAEFDIESRCYSQMLKDGWMIAMTSYRRNGYIIDEAISDINDLRDYIIKSYGQPKSVFLLGGSMGGRIVTQMAETCADKYDGAVAVGAVLLVDDPDVHYTFNPKIPILFLTNQSEIDNSKPYVAKATKTTVKPAFWVVKRDGHCNTTGEEELAALRALITYKNTGKIDLDKDGTIVPKPPASVARFIDGKAYAKVMKYGNMLTEFVAADFEKLGIKKGDRFQVRFGDKAFSVLFGTTYGDVEVGEWVGFVQAEGLVKIARNYEDAEKTLGCKEGDEICVFALPK